MVELSKEIKKLLIEKDMTATQLAEKIGMSQGNLSTKMRNESYSVADLEKIAAALNVNIEIKFTDSK